MANTRRNTPYDVYDRTSSTFYEGSHAHRTSAEMRASSSATQPLQVSKTSKVSSRPPSIPPLFFETNQSFLTPLSEEEYESPLPSANLRRSFHIRRKENPRRQKNELRMSKRALHSIITDSSSSQRLSQQSTPPLSPTRSTSSPSPLSLVPTPPLHKETFTQSNSPEGWPESPGSAYSAMSAEHNTPVCVEWDTTGYLQPNTEYSVLGKEPDEPRGEVGILKRQKTAVIVDLLRARRRRAGLEEDGQDDLVFNYR